MLLVFLLYFFFFFNDTAPTEIYTLSLHDALPIFHGVEHELDAHEDHDGVPPDQDPEGADREQQRRQRSEEHTSELQSHSDLVCRLLLEKKKKKKQHIKYHNKKHRRHITRVRERRH